MPNNPFDFVPAHSTEAEQSTLGAMLIERDTIESVAEILTPADFYRDSHQVLMECILALAREGQPVDLVTVRHYLSCRPHSGAGIYKNQLDAVGGMAYLAALFDTVPTAAHAAYYAGIVKDKAVHRKLQVTALEILDLARQEDTPGTELIETAAAKVFALSHGHGGESHTAAAKDVLFALDAKIEEQSENPAAMLGLSTGFESIDLLLSGLQAPDFIVIGARPGVGKSALATKICSNVARAGAPVFLSSMEMSQEQVMLRMICTEARIDSKALRAGRLDMAGYEQYSAAAKWLYEMPMAINDRSGVTPAYLRSEIRKFVRKHGRLGLICIDYLQLMRSDKPSRDRLAELTDVSIELKAIAREFDAPLIALSQLSRASLGRQNKRPDLPDLRETGQIEQDADIVAFLYREDMFEEKNLALADIDDSENELPVEFIVRKHRAGGTGTLMLNIVPKYTLFLEPPVYDGGF